MVGMIYRPQGLLALEGTGEPDVEPTPAKPEKAEAGG